MPAITLTELENASTDANAYEVVVNGAADVNGTGLVPTRTGTPKKTLAKLEEEYQAIIDAQTVQEETATEAAAIAVAAADSVAEGSAILADVQGAVGAYRNTNVTVEPGFYGKDTGAAFDPPAFEAWRRYSLDVKPGDRLSISILMNNDGMAAATFYDSEGVKIGDPIGVGPSSAPMVRYDGLKVIAPEGAANMKGSGWSLDDAAGPAFILVERMVLDDERTSEVNEQLDDLPYVKQVWSPSTGYMNTNGDPSVTGGWNYQIFPIKGGQSIRVEGAIANGSPTHGIIFGSGLTSGSFDQVTKRFQQGTGTVTPVSNVPQIAPPGTTHVAVSTYLDPVISVYISEVSATAAREMSDVVRILNPLHGRSVLLDGDSLAQGGGITGSVFAQVAEKLRFGTFNNRAIGGSSPTNGYYYLREGLDTIGLTGLDYSSVRVLGGCSLAELSERRTNWASFWRDRIPNAPTTISDEEYAVWTAASYENNLVPFLDDAEVFITNHAHNAAPQCPSPTGWSNFTGALTGTGTGDGVLTVSALTGTVGFPQRIFTGSAFDETGDTGLFIGAQLTGVSGQAGTYQVFGTWPGAIASTAMTGRPYNFAWNDTLLTVPGPGGTAGHTSADVMDRGYYVGAMRFRLNLWRAAQDGQGFRRPVVFAGYDQYDQKPNVCLAQDLMHTITRHPILRVWEHTGYSQNLLTAAPYAGKTMKQAWFNNDDPLHEFEDTSGRATRYLANIHASLLLQAAIGL